MPSGLVFYYFPTKRSLLLAILDERGFLPELRALIRAEMARQDDPRDELTAIGLRVLDYIDSKEAMARILAGEASGYPEVLEHLRALYAEALQLVVDYLRGEMQSGRLQPADPDVLARLFTAGVLMWALDRPPDRHEYMSKTVNAVLRGLVVAE